MKLWDDHCQRCGKKSFTHTMSRFNVELICPDCEEKEVRHPDYAKAARAEEAAIKAGHTLFPGIGFPK